VWQGWSPVQPLPEAVLPAPDNTLYDPTFEDPFVVVEWARPVAPEGAFNTQVSPDGQYLLYIVHHPGTRRVSLYSTSLATGEIVVIATADVPEEIFYFTITSDSQKVIYYQPFSGNGLYSNAITGGEELQLSDRRIWEMAVSPDGQWVVYWGEGVDSEGGVEGGEKKSGEEGGGFREGLYSVPIQDGRSVKLGEGLPQSGSYQITPDSRYVIFVAARQLGVGEPVELYRVSISGGEPLQLSHGEHSYAAGAPLITPDSQSVLYGNLYQVSIEGGAPRQLNAQVQASNSYFPYSFPPQLTPDGQWVLFLAGDIMSNLISLFSAPLDGRPTRQLNEPLSEGVGVKGFLINPDSQTVIYWQGLRDQNSDLPTYSVPVTGGSPLPVPSWHAAKLSANGQWYVYMERYEEGGADLYSRASAGGEPIKLNTSVPTDSEMAYFGISPDSQRVLYVTSKDARGGMPIFDGLYEVPITGGVAREITGIDGRDRNFGFFFAPDGQTVVAYVDYDGDGNFALYGYTPTPNPAPDE
jgi:Tol biopolymer transport system component